MDKKNILEEEVFEEVEVESTKIGENDLKVIISKEKKIENKSSKLDVKRFRKLIRQIKLSIELLKDYKNKRYTQVPWRTIAFIAAAILYFLNPMDLVPDLLPVFGITDDAILFASMFKSIQLDLEKYSSWRGLDKEEIF